LSKAIILVFLALFILFLITLGLMLLLVNY
jgi:hypothetical protein